MKRGKSGSPCCTEEGCKAASIGAWRVVLVHCEPGARAARLAARGEPELGHLEMQRWADWLLADARARGLPIIDTTELTAGAACSALVALLGLEVEQAACRGLTR